MDKFIAVMKQYNEGAYIFPQDTTRSKEILDRLQGAYAHTVATNYLLDIPHNDPFSGSQIGKPGIVLAYEKFFEYEQPKPTFAQKRKWLGGHMFELEVMYMLERMGYDYEWQPDIKVMGMISGHPDFVVEGENGRFLIECKNVADSKYKEYKRGMNNLQYITQFALYCTHYSCGGCWVIGNADTGEICVLSVPDYATVLDLYQSRIVEAVNNYSVLHAAQSFEQCLEHMPIPVPTHRADGSRGILPTLYVGKGQLHPVCSLYDYHLDEKGRYSVTGYNYPTNCKNFEPQL